MAICNPLKYATILKDMMILAIGLFICVRQLIFVFPMLLALKTISFQEKELSHPFEIYHPDIIRDTYSNPWINSFLGLFLQLYMTGTDLMFILVSYVLIIRAVLSIVAPKKQKALNTCVCHICAVTILCANDQPVLYTSPP